MGAAAMQPGCIQWHIQDDSWAFRWYARIILAGKQIPCNEFRNGCKHDRGSRGIFSFSLVACVHDLIRTLIAKNLSRFLPFSLSRASLDFLFVDFQPEMALQNNS